jgi:hypothetical protein
VKCGVFFAVRTEFLKHVRQVITHKRQERLDPARDDVSRLRLTPPLVSLLVGWWSITHTHAFKKLIRTSKLFYLELHSFCTNHQIVTSEHGTPCYWPAQMISFSLQPICIYDAATSHSLLPGKRCDIGHRYHKRLNCRRDERSPLFCYVTIRAAR